MSLDSETLNKTAMLRGQADASGLCLLQEGHVILNMLPASVGYCQKFCETICQEMDSLSAGGQPVQQLAFGTDGGHFVACRRGTYTIIALRDNRENVHTATSKLEKTLDLLLPHVGEFSTPARDESFPEAVEAADAVDVVDASPYHREVRYTPCVIQDRKKITATHQAKTILQQEVNGDALRSWFSKARSALSQKNSS